MSPRPLFSKRATAWQFCIHAPWQLVKSFGAPRWHYPASRFTQIRPTCRQHALDVLDAEAIAKAVESDAAANEPEPDVVSNEVKCQQTVRGVGVFVAFVDGRVRARFDDRTLVAIDRWHRTAEVVGRDSTCTTVSVCFERCLCRPGIAFLSHVICAAASTKRLSTSACDVDLVA